VIASLQSRTPALRGIVDWMVAFLGEVCDRTAHFWGPALASKVMGLQALANRHSTWFKKVGAGGKREKGREEKQLTFSLQHYLTIAELHFDAHVCNVTSIGHLPAPTFTPALHLAEYAYYSSQIFEQDQEFDAAFQIRFF
jgi:hypothetical protein